MDKLQSVKSTTCIHDSTNGCTIFVALFIAYVQPIALRVPNGLTPHPACRKLWKSMHRHMDLAWLCHAAFPAENENMVAHILPTNVDKWSIVIST